MSGAQEQLHFCTSSLSLFSFAYNLLALLVGPTRRTSNIQRIKQSVDVNFRSWAVMAGGDIRGLKSLLISINSLTKKLLHLNRTAF